VIELAEHPARILEVIIGWAKVHEDIRGVALVGSHARGTARLDSDIDLVVLADNPEAFRTDGSWIEAIDWRPLGRRIARRHALSRIEPGYPGGLPIQQPLLQRRWSPHRTRQQTKL